MNAVHSRRKLLGCVAHVAPCCAFKCYHIFFINWYVCVCVCRNTFPCPLRSAVLYLLAACCYFVVLCTIGCHCAQTFTYVRTRGLRCSNSWSVPKAKRILPARSSGTTHRSRCHTWQSATANSWSGMSMLPPRFSRLAEAAGNVLLCEHEAAVEICTKNIDNIFNIVIIV